MDATELGPVTNGLKAYLANVQGSDIERGDSYIEAQWTIATLEKYYSLPKAIHTVYIAGRHIIKDLQLQGNKVGHYTALDKGSDLPISLGSIFIFVD